MSIPNYYKILEINTNSTLEQIRSSYRQLVKKYHPDLGRNENDRRFREEKIKEINIAYEILNDPAKKRQYDLSLIQDGDNIHEFFNTLYTLKEENKIKYKAFQTTKNLKFLHKTEFSHVDFETFRLLVLQEIIYRLLQMRSTSDNIIHNIKRLNDIMNKMFSDEINQDEVKKYKLLYNILNLFKETNVD